jgi:2-polyprenyl-6-methoxyphenol hydroxylase-like FAD-dependent oxidoreductase
MPLAEVDEKTSPHCLIAGGGPAGLMLGYLLARAGVPVIVLEKHDDFLRDFRGDTVHPSTLAVLQQIGLLQAFEQLPQQRVSRLGVHIGGRLQPLVDFSGLKPFDHLSLVPQWDFLDLLAARAKQFANFELRMNHEVLGTIEHEGRVVGLRGRAPHGNFSLRGALVVACDGRHSVLRRAAGLRARNQGAPIDVLWFRLPRDTAAPDETFAIVGAGRMLVLLNRGHSWQAA